jgi:hypothetical protein
MIDQYKKRALVRNIKERQQSKPVEILLGTEVYFDGYEADQCVICVNNSDPISTAEFAERLREIQDRPDVSAVLVRFYDYEDAEVSEDAWISSDSIYIVTRAGVDEVREWFSDFEVADVWEDTDLEDFDGLPAVPEGFHLIAVWWD